MRARAARRRGRAAGAAPASDPVEGGPRGAQAPEEDARAAAARAPGARRDRPTGARTTRCATPASRCPARATPTCSSQTVDAARRARRRAAAGRRRSTRCARRSRRRPRRAATPATRRADLARRDRALRAAELRVEAWPLDERRLGRRCSPASRAPTRAGATRSPIARATPEPELLHAWRKRAKDLWYHQRLLAPAWPDVLGAQAEEAHALTELLGDDHDLAVLAARLERRRRAARAGRRRRPRRAARARRRTAATSCAPTPPRSATASTPSRRRPSPAASPATCTPRSAEQRADAAGDETRLARRRGAAAGLPVCGGAAGWSRRCSSAARSPRSAMAVYGTRPVQLPNLDQVLKDVGSTLGAWTYLLVGVLCFLESGAFVGLIVPGETAIIVGGVVAGQGEIDIILLIAIVWATRRRRRPLQLHARPPARPRVPRQARPAGVRSPRRGSSRSSASTTATAARPSSSGAGSVSCAPSRRSSPPPPACRCGASCPTTSSRRAAMGTLFCLVGYIFWHSLDKVLEIAKQGPARARRRRSSLVVGDRRRGAVAARAREPRQARRLVRRAHERTPVLGPRDPRRARRRPPPRAAGALRVGPPHARPARARADDAARGRGGRQLRLLRLPDRDRPGHAS